MQQYLNSLKGSGVSRKREERTLTAATQLLEVSEDNHLSDQLMFAHARMTFERS